MVRVAVLSKVLVVWKPGRFPPPPPPVFCSACFHASPLKIGILLKSTFNVAHEHERPMRSRADHAQCLKKVYTADFVDYIVKHKHGRVHRHHQHELLEWSAVAHWLPFVGNFRTQDFVRRHDRSLKRPKVGNIDFEYKPQPHLHNKKHSYKGHLYRPSAIKGLCGVIVPFDHSQKTRIGKTFDVHTRFQKRIGP